jgi:hypothetical protein
LRVYFLTSPKLFDDRRDGYRDYRLPALREAWRCGLRAIDQEALRRHGVSFHAADATEQDAMLRAAQRGALDGAAWNGMDCAVFFAKRLLPDIVTAYYAHPIAWSEIASAARRARAAMCEWISTAAILGKRPRPGPAARAKPLGKTPVSDDPQRVPRGKNGRAPDPFRVGAWAPMRVYRDDEKVDFAIVGTGAGGGTLACRLAEAGFSVVGFDAGPWWRPLEDFASDEAHQQKLYWTGERICDGADPVMLGANNSGRSIGGSTVHFAMVSLRFRPEWFKSRSLLGYGADWPVDWREMWHYYAYVEQALKIAGPVRYPWGPHRPRYPYRPHELNAAALVLAKGAEAMGIDWAPTPLATISAPRRQSPPCVYRGFCVSGCSTNAKQSALITWIPRAVAAGAEIRDLAMVGRVETDPKSGLATGVHFRREGKWRFQRARNVVVAGYAIETPRLLLNSTDRRHPDGLGNSSGLVGRRWCRPTRRSTARWTRKSGGTRVRLPSASPSTGTTSTPAKIFSAAIVI